VTLGKPAHAEQVPPYFSAGPEKPHKFSNRFDSPMAFPENAYNISAEFRKTTQMMVFIADFGVNCMLVSYTVTHVITENPDSSPGQEF
jgi:hypothetical protein